MTIPVRWVYINAWTSPMHPWMYARVESFSIFSTICNGKKIWINLYSIVFWMYKQRTQYILLCRCIMQYDRYASATNNHRNICQFEYTGIFAYWWNTCVCVCVCGRVSCTWMASMQRDVKQHGPYNPLLLCYSSARTACTAPVFVELFTFDARATSAQSAEHAVYWEYITR